MKCQSSDSPCGSECNVRNMLPQRVLARLQRLRNHHEICEQRYDEMMKRQMKEEQQELRDCVTDGSLSKYSNELGSDYVPSISDSSDDSSCHEVNTKLTNSGEKLSNTDDSDRDTNDHDTDYSADDEDEERSQITVKFCIKAEKRKGDNRHYYVYCKKPQSKMAQHLKRKHSDEREGALAICLPPASKKRRQMLKGLRRKGSYYHNIEVLQKGQVGAVQESLVSGSDVEVFTERSFEQAQASDEESDILTQKTSTPRPSDKLKRTKKTASSKEKRSRRVTEPVQDSDEESDILTQKTSTPRPSDKLKRTKKTASSKEKRSRRVTEPVQDSDEESDILTQKTSTPRPSDKLKRTEKAASSKEKRSRRVTEPVQDSDEEPDILTQKTSTPRPSDKLKRTEKAGTDPQFLSRKKCHHPWSSREKAAVWRQLGRYITLKRVPGKELCLKALDAEPILCHRDWKDVKNQVYNSITSQKRKQL